MRVVLAGGGGFIGSHMCDHFLARGDEVIIVDSFITGRRANIAHLAGHDGVTVVEHDVTRPMPEIDGAIDAVLDLASPASPIDFLRLPLEILDVGSTGTRNLLELARATGARFFLASTSEVYGDPLVNPQPESYFGNVSTTGPRSCYDEAKRFSEALTAAYERVHGLDVRMVRIFNTYGERMRPDDGRVVTNFIVQALTGKPITVYGDGTQTRSFIHVDDEVRGLLAVLDGPITTPVNVGDPYESTMLELAELIIELTNSTSEIELLPIPDERDGDPLVRCPDITIARDQLGWTPQIRLRDGLRRMIDWMTAHEEIA